MKSCCQCQGIELEFDRSVAEKKLRDYHQMGPAKTTQMLVDSIIAGGVRGMNLLDIGGGIGAIQYVLLKAGAKQATSVEASRAFLDVARQEALQQGFSDRIQYHYGNFVDLAPDLSPADVVTLDRVICCYPDMPALVSASAARANQWYGLVYPRDTWWVKLGVKVGNVLYRLQGKSFRTFAHATVAVEAILSRMGFERRFKAKTFFWQVAVYSRF